MNNIKNKNPQKGFTILVAVVTAGILLIIAMSIGGIALKEQVLSTANKESQVAFYAADTGMECALYLDSKIGIFAPDSDGNHPTVPPAGMCNGLSIDTVNDPLKRTVIGPAAPSPNVGNVQAKYSYSFKVSGIPVGPIGNEVTTCAIVTITKNTNDTNDTDKPDSARTYTDIYSYGYNTCDASLNRLERGIEGHY